MIVKFKYYDDKNLYSEFPVMIIKISYLGLG